MDLKTSLKTIKLNEPLISAILGAFVLLIIGFVAFNYIRTKTPSGSINSGISTENTEASKAPTKYTVKKGDHLWKIAEQYYKSGYNWVDIAKANNLTNPNILVAGQELNIPEVKQAVAEAQQPAPNVAPAAPNPPSAPTAPQVNEVPAQVISSDQYTVVSGDSLWKIAVRTYGDGYRWPQIAKLNNLKNPNRILVNQTLKLPPKS